MTTPDESAEDLFENAPCGYLTCRDDGTIVRANRTFERWSGHDRAALAGRRFSDLLTPAGRIYHETHYAPMLQMQGEAREIALDIIAADGSRLPALVTSLVRDGGLVRTAVFDASDRRRYEQELLRAGHRKHDIALELQRSMLGGPLPEFEHAEVEVVYRPADQGLEVGGDWYDAFGNAGRETIALVVGDVVGRGIAAAATMGQLRSAVRALASTGLSPAALIGALDGYASQHQIGHMTTLVHVDFDCATGEATYACAGHPPPLVACPGQAPRFVWDGRSVPLGAFTEPQPRSEGRVRLDPGAMVLLYSDGLIERRDRPLDQGLETLAATVAAHRQAPLGTLLGTVVESLAGGDRTDDVCLLGLRRR